VHVTHGYRLYSNSVQYGPAIAQYSIPSEWRDFSLSRPLRLAPNAWLHLDYGEVDVATGGDGLHLAGRVEECQGRIEVLDLAREGGEELQRCAALEKRRRGQLEEKTLLGKVRVVQRNLKVGYGTGQCLHAHEVIGFQGQRDLEVGRGGKGRVLGAARLVEAVRKRDVPQPAPKVAPLRRVRRVSSDGAQPRGGPWLGAKRGCREVRRSAPTRRAAS